MLILHLALTVVVPVAILIGIGWAMDRAFQLDLRTLVRLNFWVFIPAIVLDSFVRVPFSASLWLVVLFAVVQTVLLIAAGFLAAAASQLRAHRTLLVLSSFAYNIGNYGIPLVTFAFGKQWLGVVVVLMTVQTVILFILGPLFLGRESSWRKALIELCKVPTTWAVAIALAVRFTGATIPLPLMSAFDSLADGLIPIALITLGVQMARTPVRGGLGVTSAILILRLLAAPAISWLLAGLLGLDAATQVVVTVCSALPVAVNVFILCSQYGRDEQESARAVLWSTIIATLLLPLYIALLPPVAPNPDSPKSLTQTEKPSVP